MRHNPQRLAFFFILITITRVAMFVALGLNVGWFGYAFAIGLAAGVYVSAYFLRFKEAKWAAISTLAIFMLADLWFNEFENIRTVSTSQLISDNANFMNIDANTIRYGMQFSALVFGAFPTVAAALLGWLQASAETVQVLKTRSWFGKFGVGIVAKFERYFPEIEDKAKNFPQISTSVPGKLLTDGGNRRNLRWAELSAEEKAKLPNFSAGQIVSLYGGSPRRARMWKSWVKEGK